LNSEPTTDTLTITVNDGENAISDATVTIGEDSETTDENGEAVFDDMPYDDYSVSISADGYTTATETLQFRSNHKSFTVSLTATGGTGTVTVTCQDAEENLIPLTQLFLSSHSTFDWENIPSELEYIVGFGTGDETTASVTLTYNDGTQEPTGTDIPFGNYYLYGQMLASDPNDPSYEYSGTLTVDGDEEVTITLTPIDAEQNG